MKEDDVQRFNTVAKLEKEIAGGKQLSERKVTENRRAPLRALFSLPPFEVDTRFCKDIDAICSIMDLIRKPSLLTNEGHSILLCGTLLPQNRIPTQHKPTLETQVTYGGP